MDRDMYKIVDLGSANGVVHRGQRVAELPITHGLAVELSDFTVTFSLEEGQTDQTLIFGTDRTVVLGAKAVVPPPAAAPERPAAPVAPRELYLQYDAGKGPRLLKIVSGAEYVIGRSPDADLVLDDKEASTRHARIFSRGQSFFVQDLGSSNGTAVNGQRVDEGPIDAGDEIQIGRSLIDVKGEREESDEAAILPATRIGANPFAKKERPAPAPVPAAGSAAGAAPAAARRPAAAPLIEEPPEGGSRKALPVLLIGGAVAAVLVIGIGIALFVAARKDGAGPRRRRPRRRRAGS